MTIQSYISDELLVEGLFGALSWYIYWKILNNILELSPYIEAAIAWTLVWYTRKFGVTLYQSFKKKHNIKDKKFYFYK
jgi:hypothetical protein